MNDGNKNKKAGERENVEKRKREIKRERIGRKNQTKRKVEINMYQTKNTALRVM
jgi:hypothetical protein